MRGSELMRVNTIRHRAWLAWRLPPRLSRWRVGLAGRGVDRGDPAEVGEGGLGGDPLGVVAGGDEQQGGGVGADTVEGEQARRGRADEVGELVVEAGAVGVDVEHPAAEGLHGQLGGVHDGVAVGVRAQRGGGLGEGADGDATEPFPQLIGGAEAEMAELVEALDAGVAPGAEGDQQHPDRLHVAVGGLGHRPWPGHCSAARAASTASIAVGLAVAAAGLTVRAIDLDHHHPDRAQEAGQAGPVGAGALDPDPAQRAEADTARRAARRTRRWSSGTTRRRARRRWRRARRRHERRGGCRPHR